MAVRRMAARIITVIIIMGGLGMGFIATGHAAVCQRMAIPAYFYPGPLWDQATAGAPKVGVMIMNPNSGPGASQNPDYVAAVTRAKAAGIKVLGYVHTSYGTVSPAAVKAEIDAYKAWYQVNGIFLDEVSADKALIPYYQELATYIRATPGTLVMLNPGIVPDQGYMNVGDIVVVFEGTYDTYKTLKLPPWVFNYPGTKFAHLVHATSKTAAMKNAISLAKKRNAANVFVTNDVLPNPWDTLPGYWSQELQTLPANC